MNTVEIQGNVEKRVQDYLYYFMIAIISLCAMFVIPCFGSTVGMEWNFPNSVVGWIVFITSKLTVAIVNILIFHGFIKQSRINIRDNPNYVEAMKILNDVGRKTYTPRSLAEINKKEYGHKMITIFISSMFSAFSFSQAILTFDITSLISYSITVLFGIIFGLLEMKKYEDYYTHEFVDYAKYIQEKQKGTENELHEN